jgi:hypothetical protein
VQPLIGERVRCIRIHGAQVKIAASFQLGFRFTLFLWMPCGSAIISFVYSHTTKNTTKNITSILIHPANFAILPAAEMHIFLREMGRPQNKGQISKKQGRKEEGGEAGRRGPPPYVEWIRVYRVDI